MLVELWYLPSRLATVKGDKRLDAIRKYVERYIALGYSSPTYNRLIHAVTATCTARILTPKHDPQ